MKTTLLTAAITLCFAASAQNGNANYWSASTDQQVKVTGKRQIVPNVYKTFNLNLNDLKGQLANAPHEKTMIINNSNCIISLPAPNGQMQLFRVVEAPIMEAPLAAAYPDIKTYSIKGLTDIYANGKIDITEFGFHGMVRSVNGDYFIDPYCLGNTEDYMTYYTANFVKPEHDRLPEVGLEGENDPEGANDHRKTNTSLQKSALMPPATCIGPNLRTYRLAIACTGEYAVAATGSTTPTVAQTLAKIVTSVNRVTGVYETDVAIRLTLVATETNVIFTSSSTDPFTGNNNASTLISESQTVMTNSIGAANYDIGHTFSTGGGGLANLGCVCGSSKARGITGSPSPVGDPYDIDYVAHEMGHQFGGNHTFNSTSGSCSGNRNSGTAVEPGSGITIMGYAGICGTQDLAAHSIAYFHATSYDEIVNFTQTGGGNSCSQISPTGNTAPSVTITGGSSFIVPANTPFILTGIGSDLFGDPLTYSWEERDAGTTSGNWNSGNKPFFRSYDPVTVGSRMFPFSTAVLTGSLQGYKGEYLPTTAQTLNFRLTARDNKAGGGGVCYAQCTLTVSGTAGPFSVTVPTGTGVVWGAATQQTVAWNVNSTDIAPISCASVNILVSYDGGNSFSMLLANTANDGTEIVNTPSVATTISTCRIKVEAVGNIFFDINSNDFEISTAPDAGVHEISASNPLGVKVLPNPFTNEFQLKVPALSDQSKTEVIVTDVLGKELKKVTYNKVSALNEQINLSDLDAAVYFVTVKNANKTTTIRIIKQ
jgi:hypothetical protein